MYDLQPTFDEITYIMSSRVACMRYWQYL